MQADEGLKSSKQNISPIKHLNSNQAYDGSFMDLAQQQRNSAQVKNSLKAVLGLLVD